MARRIGVMVGSDSVAVVCTDGGEIEWCSSAPIGDVSVGEAVEALLRSTPRLWWPRPQITVALGAPQHQSKIVRGLPPITDVRALARVVAATPQRFFLDLSGGLATTGVRVDEPGVITVAAFSIEAIDGIVEAGRRAGYTVGRIVPADIAMTALAEEQRSHSCAIALSAALLPSTATVVLRVRRVTTRRARLAKRLAGIAAAVIAIVVCATGPAIRARYVAADAERQLASMTGARRDALATSRQLAADVRSINAVAAFERGRSSATLLLAQLADALPTGAAVLTLRADSSGVTVTALAPRAAELVQDMEEIPGVEQSTIVGPVTHETVGAAELERITLHFRVRPDSRVARVAFAVVRDADAKGTAANDALKGGPE
jgi:type IV pilus assembly PilN-like protein